MSKSKEPTLRDILMPIIPKMIEFLLQRSGARSRAALANTVVPSDTPESSTPNDSEADASMPDANALYRYAKSRVVPMKNLPKLGKLVGFGPGQTAWLLGHFLMEENKDTPVDLDLEPSKVRESRPRHDAQSLKSDLAKIMAFDFKALGPEEMFAFNRERNALRTACDEAQAEIEDAKDRVDRRVAALLDLLGLFIERSEKALLRAHSGRFQ